MANNSAYKFYGYTKKEFTDIFAHELYKDNNDRIRIISNLNNSVKNQNYIIEQRCKSDVYKWVISNYELIEYNKERCILETITDITEIKKMENELLDHASIDILTGILNRRAGLKLIEDELKVSKTTNKLFVVCFIDINNLKIVNDNYGHSEGDFFINIVCSVIKEFICNTDIFFRYGGDEFIILFSNKNINDVKEIWMQIQNKFCDLNKSNFKPYNISVSHGLFEFRSDTKLTLEEILSLADTNMYLEKNQYKKANI